MIYYDKNMNFHEIQPILASDKNFNNKYCNKVRSLIKSNRSSSVDLKKLDFVNSMEDYKKLISYIKFLIGLTPELLKIITFSDKFDIIHID